MARQYKSCTYFGPFENKAYLKINYPALFLWNSLLVGTPTIFSRICLKRYIGKSIKASLNSSIKVSYIDTKISNSAIL